MRLNASGLSDLRRDLGKIDKDLGKSATTHLRGVAAKVRVDARVRTPVRSGRLQRSVRYSVRAKGASIYSNEVYAPVIEYGGTIAPSGTPFTIKPRRFLNEAADANTRFIEEELGQLLDVIAGQNGFT